MIYNSIDTIPAKLFFKIMETGNIYLLSDEGTLESDLETVWERLQEEHEKYNPDDQIDKSFILFKKMESLAAKYEAIRLSVHLLRSVRDPDIFQLLKSYGYKITWENLQKDLDTVQRESQAIEAKILRAQDQLPKPKKNSGNLSFDEAVLGYASFTGSGFIDTDKITIPQYYALINIGNKKIKALENGKAKQNNKG